MALKALSFSFSVDASQQKLLSSPFSVMVIFVKVKNKADLKEKVPECRLFPVEMPQAKETLKCTKRTPCTLALILDSY